MENPLLPVVVFIAVYLVISFELVHKAAVAFITREHRRKK